MSALRSASQPVRLFSDRSHYVRAERGQLADVLKPFWKDREISEEERRATYGPHADRYRVVDTPDPADVAVLPMSWNHYHSHAALDRARVFIRTAKRAGLPVATWVTGDFGVSVPDPEVFVFRQSGYASRRLPHQHALPAFIRDPLPHGFSEEHLRAKGSRPVVGFCGQAADSGLAQLTKAVRTIGRNTASILGLSPVDPQAVYPATRLRARALELLERSSLVETRFVKREKYRGGARDDVELRRLRAEFWANIRESDYTVCVRGSGNFSARLFETLAMGRIPVFVDTDCILPFDDRINWRRHVVWVASSELDRLPERVAEHHAAMDADSFLRLQRANRRLWEEHLSLAGFLAHFPDYFSILSATPA